MQKAVKDLQVGDTVRFRSGREGTVTSWKYLPKDCVVQFGIDGVGWWFDPDDTIEVL